MRIVITGAGGFIGRHLVNYLVAKEHDVVIIGRPVENLRAVFKAGVEILESDYSVKDLEKHFKGADCVVHLAAQLMERDTDPFKLSNFYKANILLVENVLLASKQSGVKKICQPSSISVYSSENKLPFTEKDVPIASNIYGVSKLSGENLAEYFQANTDMEIIILRFARIFGIGGRAGQLIMDSVDKAKARDTLKIYGEGKSAVDYIYIKDVLSAIERSLAPRVPGGIYNVGSGKAYSVLEVVKTVNKVFGSVGNIDFDRTKKEDGDVKYLDVKKAKEHLNWEVSWTLEKALCDIKSNYPV